jgi:hypothetical protein
MFGYSAGKKQIKKQNQKPFTAVYLDFDEVINRSEEADKTGFVGGALIAGDVLAEVNILCKKHNIPVYIITNRATNAKNLQHIDDLIGQAGGFAKDHELGGFKKSYIHCLGIETRNRQGHSSLIGVHRSKLQEIDAIHQKELSFLDKNAQLVVDDDASNLNPIKEAGYTTHLAKCEDDSHMQVVLDFIKKRLEAFYDFSLDTLFFLSVDALEDKASESTSATVSEKKNAELSGKYEFRDALYLKRLRHDTKSAASVAVTVVTDLNQCPEDIKAISCGKF